jgi:thioredoxin reductase
MVPHSDFDVIIIGGSYAGLSAAMALGRSLRKVLVIDSGLPCNRQTPYSHNFITHDGEKPADIIAKAKNQLLHYDTVQFVNDKAKTATRQNALFIIQTEFGATYAGKKLLFATGIIDIMPEIEGFAACWGISVLHCPYCHGYEVKGQKTGILGNGELVYEFSKMIRNWTHDLTLFTHGPSTLSAEQMQNLERQNIRIVETELIGIHHTSGQLNGLMLKDGITFPLTALYAKLPFQQHCTIPQALGCALSEAGYIAIDDFHRTTVAGVYAAGDNTTPFRAVSVAVASGMKAGAFINKELIEEDFLKV